MPKKIYLFVISLGLFAAFHQLALTFSLYWYYWWFDWFMHLLGGILLGWLYYLVTAHWLKMKQYTIPAILFLLVMIIGWEVYEYIIQYVDSDYYEIDTAIDITLGLTGGLLVHFVTKAYTIR